MLWFWFFHGLKYFQPIGFLFSFVLDYDIQNKSENQIDLFEKFKPWKKLHHNIYTNTIFKNWNLKWSHAILLTGVTVNVEPYVMYSLIKSPDLNLK